MADYYKQSDTRNAAEAMVRDLLQTITKRDFINSLGYVVNENLLAKEAVRRIFKAELQAKKANRNVLLGALNTFNHFLGSHPGVAFLEVIEVANELVYCYEHDSRKTIHEACGEAITRLFLTIYIEHNIMPGGAYGDIADKFKEHITKDKLKAIVGRQEGYALSFMWRQFRLKDWREHNASTMAQQFVENFYGLSRKKSRTNVL